ncbi:MAG: hypothetical protein Q9167_007585 [Letrouitia subvulpina]
MSPNAGTTDSALTVHGVLQAERLGQFLAESDLRSTHIFSSDLQRAFKTADALRVAEGKHGHNPVPDIVQLPLLREQDFGYYEGKSVSTVLRDPVLLRSSSSIPQHDSNFEFREVETKESMGTRAHTFIKDYIMPLIYADDPGSKYTVIVVSHGILLVNLWRSLLNIFAKQTVSLAPGLSVGSRGLEHLGWWSNTGYLEVEIHEARTPEPASSTAADATADAASIHTSHRVESLPAEVLGLPPSFKMTVRTINGMDHLKGLKRTRGVGSSKHHEDQQKIESFFKKSKTE